MNYKLKRSQRKTIALQIRDGEVLVRAPFFVSQKKIDQFIYEKESWIKEKLKTYRKPGINFPEGFVYLFGRKRKIVIQTAKHWSMTISDKIEVNVRSNMLEFGIEKRMEEHFKDILKEKIEASLVRYVKALKIKTPNYIIRKYKRMHGRCLSNGELAFNTLLYEHSEEFIDYVVLHECVHLIEFNHSAKFYQIIESHLPNYKQIIHQDTQALRPHQE